MSTVSSIGSGKTYTSLSSWHAAFAAGGWIGEIYGELTDTLNFSGASTTSSNYITLRASSGQGVAAITSTGPLRYNGTLGGAVKSNTSYATTFTVSEDYVTLSGLQIAQTHVSGAWALSNNGFNTNSVVENCIIENQSTNNTTILWRTGLVRNSLIVNRTSSQHAIDLSYAFPTIVNCTIVRTGTAAGNAFNGGGAVAKNCAVFGFSSFVSGTMGTGSDYNASDVTIPIGTHNQASKTYSSQFQNITDASRDFRAKTGADLLDNGVTDTTNIPAATDIIGTSRPQGTAWDIGCWELASGGGGVSGTSAWTEAADTWAGAGAVAVSGTAAWTEVKDTWAGAGAVAVSGTAAWTEVKDNWAGAGAVAIAGTAAWTEVKDTWALAGSVITGASGSIAWTEAVDIWAGAGAVAISGVGAWTETKDTWAVSGSIALSGITGSLSWVELTDLWAGVGANGVIWTPVTPGSQLWTAATPDSSIWTPATLHSQTWTPQ